MKIFSAICLAVVLPGALDLNAQIEKRDYIITGAAVFISGLIDGTVESINYHYEEGFKPACPNANDKFWNPAISWKNKYRDNNPANGPRFSGSTTVFAFTTDAYHLLRATNRTIDGVCLAYLLNANHQAKMNSLEDKTNGKEVRQSIWKRRWFVTSRDFLALFVIRTAGFHLSYSLVFRKQ